MRRPPQHQIDDAAQSAFNAALPCAWVARKQDPDYGIDYSVEVVTENDLTGQKFAVQLKGTSKLCSRKRTVRFPLKTHHLAYYIDRCREPVFLVVADVNTGQCYWLFLQQYVLEQMEDRRWRSKGQVTVRIPEHQRLDDRERLQSAVAQAEQYMTALRPSAIPIAVDAEKRRMEGIDPRFAVTIQADGKKTRYRLDARKPVEWDLMLRGTPDRVRQALRDLTERGVPVDLADLEVGIKGLPLIESVLSDITTIRHQKSLEARLEMSAVAEGHEVCRLDTIVGTLAGGSKEMSFAGELADTPLSARFTYLLDKPSGDKLITINFGFDLTRWAGQPIRMLAYFESLYKLFMVVRRGGSLQIRCTVKGRELFTGRCELAIPPRQVTVLAYLREAREVAEACNVNPIMPESITEEDAARISEAHWRVLGEARKIGAMEITTTSTREGAESLLRNELKMRIPSDIKATVGPATTTIFGTPVRLPAFEMVLTEAYLQSPREEIESALSDSAADTFHAVWAGTDGSELSARPLWDE